MTKSELIARLAQRYPQLVAKDAEYAVKMILDAMTHALLEGSPAIDHGNNEAGLDYDQRGTGFPRVQGTQADIGAFER